MTLLVAVCIDANDETLPMAWALVPIESEAWWTWFLKQFEKAFHVNSVGNVVMSDREKGLPAAIERAIPDVTQAYCCQHIADNVQQRFGIKCRPLFWACAQARYQGEFQNALKALEEEDVHAANYVNAIKHHL
jgi:transposase-like protein